MRTTRVRRLGSQTLSALLTTSVALLLVARYSCAGSSKGSGASTDKSKSRQTHEVIDVGNRRYYVRYELKAPFTLTQGRLCICVKPEWQGSVPIESYERLYLILPSKPPKVIEIDGLNKLRGYVKIETPQAALAFARLRTSPKTLHAFENCWEVEIVSRDQIDQDFFFGDEWRTEYMRKHGESGIDGIFSKREKVASFGISPAQCRKTSKGFEIQRRLVVRDRGGVQMIKVVETVGTDGSCRRKESNAINVPKNSELYRVFPIFM